jgi:phage-related tail fiber protein
MKRTSFFLFALILTSFVYAQSSVESQTVGNALNEVSGLQSSHVASMVSFSHKENTKGSRYLFDNWVKGSVVNKNDVLINNENFSFNYDKISNELYLTSDKKQSIEIDKEQIKSFILKDNSGKEYDFVRVDAIKPNTFFQSLSTVAGNKFAAYKWTKTRFKKSDYRTDGLTESGNNYDEYVDESTYYAVDLKTNTVIPFELKKKSIKEAFGTDKPNTDKYFSEHKEDDFNDDFITGLVNYLNSK